VFWEVEALQGFLPGRGHLKLDLGLVWDLRLHLSDTDPRGLIDLNSAIQSTEQTTPDSEDKRAEEAGRSGALMQQ